MKPMMAVYPLVRNSCEPMMAVYPLVRNSCEADDGSLSFGEEQL